MPSNAPKPPDPYLVEAAAFCGLVLVGVIDRVTPVEFSTVLLYLIPLGIVAWYGAPGGQWRVAIIAVLVWSILDNATQQDRADWLAFWLVLEKVFLFGGGTYLIRRLKEALVSQEKLSDMLAARVRVVEQLAAGVAHEVRNPLGTLLAGVEYLGRRDRPEGERQLVEDMHGAVVRAEIIVRDLNDFSAPLRLKLTPVDAVYLIAQAVKEAQLKSAGSGVTVVMEDVPALTVQADTTRIVQVLVNLLRNAVDVTSSGGVVRIGARVEGDYLAIDVDDEGPGITPENLAKVFEPFFTTKAPGSGTGLGLAVSQRIARDHLGGLRLLNRADAGLRATLTLPMKEKT